MSRVWSSVSGMPTPAPGSRHVRRGTLALLVAFTALVPEGGAAPLWQGPLGGRSGLDAASLAEVVRRVVPGSDELAWRAIPWRATLRAGLQDATEERKPVLLWAMNGHPLGTT
jgi:hypothetical protein